MVKTCPISIYTLIVYFTIDYPYGKVAGIDLDNDIQVSELALLVPLLLLGGNMTKTTSLFGTKESK